MADRPITYREALSAALREEMQRVKADLVKWSFAFWVGNVAALAGIMPAMLRFRG